LQQQSILDEESYYKLARRALLRSSLRDNVKTNLDTLAINTILKITIDFQKLH